MNHSSSTFLTALFQLKTNHPSLGILNIELNSTTQTLDGGTNSASIRNYSRDTRYAVQTT